MYRQQFPNDPGMHNMPETYNTRISPRRQPRPLTFWDRVKRSMVAIVVGLIIITVASGVLFWNEGRAVQTSRSLDEGLKAVRLLPTSSVIFDENNGKLVYVTGSLHTSKALYDEAYSVAVQAVKLQRRVEMYQWVEQETRRDIHEDDSTREEVSYSYSQQWRSDLIRSSSFNNRLHVNPEKMPLDAKMYTAEDAQIGSFSLSQNLLEKITNFREIHPDGPPKDPYIKIHQGIFYHGYDPLHPQIGDFRVTFEYAGLSGKETSPLGGPDKVSVLAKQTGDQLSGYLTEAGDAIEFLYSGQHTAEYMIGREHMSNTLVLWGLRFVGWLLLFIAFGCLATFITTIVDWLPIMREIITFGSVTLSLVLSISLSLTLIAFGWIWYRPYLGFSILFIAMLPYIVSRLRLRSASNYRVV